jgi:hypothetical protein
MQSLYMKGLTDSAYAQKSTEQPKRLAQHCESALKGDIIRNGIPRKCLRYLNDVYQLKLRPNTTKRWFWNS